MLTHSPYSWVPDRKLRRAASQRAPLASRMTTRVVYRVSARSGGVYSRFWKSATAW
jgi:hypothetical protein